MVKVLSIYTGQQYMWIKGLNTNLVLTILTFYDPLSGLKQAAID